VRPIAIRFDRASFDGSFSFGEPADDPLLHELYAQGVPVYSVACGDDLPAVFA